MRYRDKLFSVQFRKATRYIIQCQKAFVLLIRDWIIRSIFFHILIRNVTEPIFAGSNAFMSIQICRITLNESEDTQTNFVVTARYLTSLHLIGLIRRGFVNSTLGLLGEDALSLSQECCQCPMLVFSLLTRTPSGARVPCHAAAKTALIHPQPDNGELQHCSLQHCRHSHHAGFRHSLVQK